MDKDEQELLRKLNKSIRKLNKNIDKQISLKWIFFRGLINGLGYAIATTIIIGLIISFLAQHIDSVEDVPILKDFVEPSQIEEVINQGSTN